MKQLNQYATAAGADLYVRTPKAVWAALAMSFALRLNEENFDALPVAIAVEWDTLHRAGIVPQPAPRPGFVLARRDGL